MVSLKAGDHAVQFGHFQNAGVVNVLGKEQQGVLQLQIGSIVGGIINVHAANADLVPTLKPMPLNLAPRPFLRLVGRQQEIARTLKSLAESQPTELYGIAGIGKTVILRHLTHHPSIRATFPDGILYHHPDRNRTVSDLLQELFDAFYYCPLPTKPSDSQLRSYLQERQALILLDGLSFGQDEVQALLNAVPKCTFLLAMANRQLWGEGSSINVSGLPLADSLVLIVQELGRSLTPEEAKAAEILCQASDGHPLKIIQAVAQTQTEQKSLLAIAQDCQAAKATDGWVMRLLPPLNKPQRLIVALLAALGMGMALGVDRIADLTKVANVRAELDSLVQAHIVQQDGDRYQLEPAITATLQQRWQLNSWKEQLSKYFQLWMDSPQTTLEACNQETDAILRVLDWAIAAERWTDVLNLARQIEGVLAISGRWDEWRRVLHWLLEATRYVSDRALEAFALHQLGTLALAQGNLTVAQTVLTEALHIREALNDTAGLAATQHNLNLLLPPVAPLPEPPVPLGGKVLWLAGVGGVVTVLITTALVWQSFPALRCMVLPASCAVPVSNGVSLKFAQSSVRPGGSLTGEVVLDSAAPPEGIRVSLKSSDSTFAAVPREVLIPAGATSTSVTVNTSKYVLEGAKVTITPTLNGMAGQPAEITILVALPQQVTLTLESATALPGDTLAGTLTLDLLAPPEGTIVMLQSSNLALAKIPSQVTIPAKTKTAQINVEIPETAIAGQTVTITPSLNGTVTNPSTIRIVPQPPRIAALQLELVPLPTFREGTLYQVRGLVQLTTPAPEGGTAIALTSRESSLTQNLPDQVIVPADKTSVEFKFFLPTNLSDYPDGANLTITATYADSEQAETVTLPAQAPPSARLQSLELNPQEVTQGWQQDETVYLTVTLDKPTPMNEFVVSLKSSQPALVVVPATVQIPQGERSVTVPIQIVSHNTQKNDATYSQGASVENRPVLVTATSEGVAIDEKLTVKWPSNDSLKFGLKIWGKAGNGNH